MATLGELDPVGDPGGDGGAFEMSAVDPTSWHANNLLGRYHTWRIGSAYPIPGTAVLNDLRRATRAPTAAAKEAEALALRAAAERREEIKRWGARAGGYGPLNRWRPCARCPGPRRPLGVDTRLLCCYVFGLARA